VRVAVRNGSGRTGAGSTTLDALKGAGFAVLPPATNADRSDYTISEVRYAPGAGNQNKAKLVLAYLGGAGKVVALQGATEGADVVLVVGRDFSTISAPAARPPATRGAPSQSASPTTGAPAPAADALPPVGC
jgi:hypothetical protein